MADDAGLTLARVRRMLAPESTSPELGALAAKSRRLQLLLAVEEGPAPQAAVRPYQSLAAGRIDEATQGEGPDPARTAQVLRLAAASDGASAALIKRAMALPFEQGQDSATVWTGLALATRHGGDTAPWRAATRVVSGGDPERMLAFFDRIAAGKDPLAADRLLDAADPDMRLHAWSAALVLLGEKAPPAWRKAVTRMLFASERPYFKQL
ncbi:hypothetical protein [Massilia mucilaginosa]|nr:hypothetical protein [Massilia mucilaginosa]